MSATLVGLALERRGLSKTEKLVLIGLADCSNTATGECFPAIPWLSRVALCSERHASRCVKHLETMRLILVARRPGKSSNYIVFPSQELLSTPDTMSGVTPDTHVGGRDVTPDTMSGVTPDIAMSGTPDIAMSDEPERTLREEHARETLWPHDDAVEETTKRIRDGQHHWRPGGPDDKCSDCDLTASDHVEQGDIA